MFKIMKEEAPNYLLNLVSKCETNTRARSYSIPTFNRRKDYFKHSSFPSTLNDWFSFGLNIRNLESISIFTSRLSFTRPVQLTYTIFLTHRFDISNSPEIKSQSS